MYTISYFGQTAQGTGTIRETLAAVGLDVGQNHPYVDGNEVSFDSTPAAGKTVTFRPKASGKA